LLSEGAVALDIYLLIIFVGFLYILLLGGSSLLRRERLSGQFAFEATIITLIFGGLAYVNVFQINPVLFLVVLYLVTMRVRLLVDLGNLFAKRNQHSRADSIYHLAERLWPDTTSLLVIWVNKGTSLLVRGDLDGAISIFKEALSKVEEGGLGVKYEAAAHYNLGVAYLRKDMAGMANREFNAVLDTSPGSTYANRAEEALERARHLKKSPRKEGDSPDS
jgi:tetratricopeptide (TPR) repeat protein